MIDNQTLHVIVAITDERDRQLNVEGYTRERDDGYTDGALGFAAVSYICYALGRPGASGSMWPWSPATFKPKNQRHDLIRAAALIVAELERLGRVSESTREPQVLSGCAVRATIQQEPTDEAVKARIPETVRILVDTLKAEHAETLELQRRQFMAAIDFALELGGAEGTYFLSEWREGDTSDWPEFKGPMP